MKSMKQKVKKIDIFIVDFRYVILACIPIAMSWHLVGNVLITGSDRTNSHFVRC